jgi:hypothetical protein
VPEFTAPYQTAVETTAGDRFERDGRINPDPYHQPGSSVRAPLLCWNSPPEPTLQLKLPLEIASSPKAKIGAIVCSKNV